MKHNNPLLLSRLRWLDNKGQIWEANVPDRAIKEFSKDLKREGVVKIWINQRKV